MQAWMEQNHSLGWVYTLLRLNKQLQHLTLRSEQMSTWAAAASGSWRGPKRCCLCWEADWDLLFFDERHNKITSLPLSTTIQYFALRILPESLGVPRLPLRSAENTKGQCCNCMRCLKNTWVQISSSPPAGLPARWLAFNITFALSSMHAQEPRSTSSRFEAGVFADGRCVWGLWTFTQRHTRKIQSFLCVLLSAWLCEACWHSRLPLLF